MVAYFSDSGGSHYYDMKSDKEFVCLTKEIIEDMFKTLLFDDTIYGECAVEYGYQVRKNLSTLSRMDNNFTMKSFLKR